MRRGFCALFLHTFSTWGTVGEWQSWLITFECLSSWIHKQLLYKETLKIWSHLHYLVSTKTFLRDCRVCSWFCSRSCRCFNTLPSLTITFIFHPTDLLGCLYLSVFCVRYQKGWYCVSPINRKIFVSVNGASAKCMPTIYGRLW